ncbi:MAG: MDR/zinc-dependent alcohol dehydrogenase-like family protein [Chitinispirillaceae bacterium]
MRGTDTESRFSQEKNNGSEQFQAMVCESPGNFTPGRALLRRPSFGEAVIRLEGCGVCASNLPVFEGRPWFSYPLEPGAPGHEGWGVVQEIGEGVENVSPGDRVAFLSGNAFAEYETVSVSQIATLPAGLAGKPFPGEPLGCAVNVFRRCPVQKGERVAVVGTGFMGVLLVKLCALAGADVIALSRRPYSLEMARQFGASHTVRMDDHWKTVEQVKGLTSKEGCSKVFEASGYQWPLDLATEITSTRGTLVIAGYHQDNPRSVNMQQWNWKGLDVINAHERDNDVYMEGIRGAIDMVSRGELDPSPLYTHVFPLSELNEAFSMLRMRPDSFMKALVTV